MSYDTHRTRLPVAPCDIPFKVTDPAQHNYIVVVRKNKFYQVPVVDGQGEFLSERDLQTLFEEVVRVAGETQGSDRLGALTAADRDVWTKVPLPIFLGHILQLS